MGELQNGPHLSFLKQEGSLQRSELFPMNVPVVVASLEGEVVDLVADPWTHDLTTSISVLIHPNLFSLRTLVRLLLVILHQSNVVVVSVVNLDGDVDLVGIVDDVVQVNDGCNVMFVFSFLLGVNVGDLGLRYSVFYELQPVPALSATSGPEM